MVKKDRSADVGGKDRERWLGRFQLRLVTQPGVDREVVLRAVKEVTVHCDETGEDPLTAFGDPDAYAVEAAARLVPPERAERERRRDGVLKRIASVGRKAGDIAGM